MYGQTATWIATVSGYETTGTTVGFYAGAVTQADFIANADVSVVNGVAEAILNVQGLPVSPSPYSIMAVYGNLDNQQSTSNTITLTVTPAPLVITASNQTMTYGGTLSPLSATVSGFVNGDSVSHLTTLPVITTAPATSNVGTYAITACGAYDPNYTISYVPGQLTINPAPLVITANNESMTYGGSLPALSVSFSGLVNGDTPATFSTGGNVAPTAATVPASSNAGTYTISVAGAYDPNYAITYADGYLTVTPAALTITASSASKVYGAALPALTASYSGFVNGDTSNSLTTQPSFSTTATASSPVGTYAITVSGAADPNYAICYVAGSLSVTPGALTITVNSPSKVYGAALPALTASYSGFVNGDTSASLTTQPTLSTTATASSAVGTYTTTAKGAVDANYTISYVAGTLSVTPAALTITASSRVQGLRCRPARPHRQLLGFRQR